VSYGEMIEHSFYQLLNLVQIVAFHALDSRWLGAASNNKHEGTGDVGGVGGVGDVGDVGDVGSSDKYTPASESSLTLNTNLALCRAGVILIVTAPWLFRHLVPVNSFSKNYKDTPLSQYSAELFMYRVKKWQYVFYKHVLFHGLNITMATRPFAHLTSQPLFLIYWIALNTSYVMEFFLQTLVKKKYMSQGGLLRMQWLLMIASTSSAIYILSYVRWGVALASHVLNMTNRGHDFFNVTMLLMGALAYDYFAKEMNS
jgi:hypothetical protein